MTQKTILLPAASNGHEAQYRLTVSTPKRRYWSYLKERWWVTLICICIGMSAFFVYETVRPETYTSFAQLYLSGDVQINTGIFVTEDTVNYYGTQIELLKSPRLQAAAFDRAGIVLPPGKKSPFKVEVYQPMKTSILLVQATGPEPIQVQKLLQALLQEYLAYKKETRKNTTEDLVNSLTAELGKRESDLKAEQDKWADFQKSNNMAVLEDQAKSAGLYLSDLNLQLEKLKLEMGLAQHGLGEEKTPAWNKTTVAAPTLTTTGSVASASLAPGNDTALRAAEVELAVLLAQRDQQTNELGELHPALRKLNSDIARVRKTVAVLSEQDVSQKHLEAEEVSNRIAAIELSIPSVEAKVLAIDERLSEGQRLKNNIQRQQGFYDHLLSMLQGVDLSKSVEQERLSVLQEPSPARPTERYLSLRVGLAGFAGGFIGLGILFLWYLIDDRFVSVRDVREQFGEPVLGLVPQVRTSRSEPSKILVEPNDSRASYLEAYRHLRSALLLSSAGEQRPQTILFTGAGPAEGKTTVAANLARVLARSGLKVILVEADPQAGALHRLLKRPPAPGMLDYLSGQAGLPEIVQTTEISDLKFIGAGSNSGESDDLFLCSRIDDFFSELRKDCDFIILDGAPILAADDAALLVPHADSVVLVVRPFFTRSRAVRQALDMLYQRKARQVSIVLNRARSDDFARNYGQNGMRKASSRTAAAAA